MVRMLDIELSAGRFLALLSRELQEDTRYGLDSRNSGII